MKSCTFVAVPFLFLKGLAIVLGLLVFSCQNESDTPNKASQAQAIEPPAAEPVNDFAIPGSEKPVVKDLGNGTKEYTYQRYKVKTVSAGGPYIGYNIFVYNEKGEEIWKTENIGYNAGKWFTGISDDNAFLDIGTGPIGQILMVYDLKNRKQGFAGEYFGVPSISNGILVFDRVVSEAAAGNVDCPQEKEWEKKQLGIGYGQTIEYALQTGQITNKPIFKCYAIQ